LLYTGESHKVKVILVYLSSDVGNIEKDRYKQHEPPLILTSLVFIILSSDDNVMLKTVATFTDCTKEENYL
jgi:hypothetical protein